MNIIEQNIIQPLAECYLRVLLDWDIPRTVISNCDEGDHCDANMAMLAAFTDFGIDFSEIGMTEQDCVLWNTVWDYSNDLREPPAPREEQGFADG